MMYVMLIFFCLTEVRAQDRISQHPLIDTIRILRNNPGLSPTSAYYGKNHAQPGTVYIIDNVSFNKKSPSFNTALYNSGGTLIANHNLKLSAGELAIWNKIKDSLIAIAYRELRYHPLFADNEMQFRIIFEIVFKPRKSVTFRVYQSSIQLNDSQLNIILDANGNMFRSWDAVFKKAIKTNQIVKLHLPIRYEVPSTAATHHYAPAADSVYVNNGWITLRAGVTLERSQR